MLGTAVFDKPPVVLDGARRVAANLEQPGQIVVRRRMPGVHRQRIDQGAPSRHRVAPRL